ncbi:MAG: glycosyltransferase [Desulfobacterales bacterium]|nr:glycosyltransferase [Desulfobacterales bacterium]
MAAARGFPRRQAPTISEIVVVDDGSSDRDGGGCRGGTRRARQPARIESPPQGRGTQGKGASVREGVLAAAGEIALFADDDLSTPIEEADKLGGGDRGGGRRRHRFEGPGRLRRSGSASAGRARAWASSSISSFGCWSSGVFPTPNRGFKALPEGGGRRGLLGGSGPGASPSAWRSRSSAGSWAIAWPKSPPFWKRLSAEPPPDIQRLMGDVPEA